MRFSGQGREGGCRPFDRLLQYLLVVDREPVGGQFVGRFANIQPTAGSDSDNQMSNNVFLIEN